MNLGAKVTQKQLMELLLNRVQKKTFRFDNFEQSYYFKRGKEMKIFVTMKSLAKRKNYLTKKETHLSRKPSTLRELLEELVTMEIHQLNDKKPEMNLAAFLTNKEIELQAEAGKVGFSFIYNEQKVNFQDATQTSIQAF